MTTKLSAPQWRILKELRAGSSWPHRPGVSQTIHALKRLGYVVINWRGDDRRAALTDAGRKALSERKAP